MLSLVTLLTAACADNTTPATPEAGVNEGGVDANEPLRACDSPGQSCAAHTTCAIDPVCGQDKLCHPSGYQNCDDGLACTTDTCLGKGACDHKPADGTCALPVKTPSGTVIQCFKEGDRNPDPTRGCLVCDPSRDPSSWSPANGGPCDDGNDCTKDDYCNNGQCTGTYYGDECQDDLGCTDDICDGKGGCVGNPLRSDSCLIAGVCYKDKEKHPSGSCVQCDVNSSQSQWTNIAQTCHIDGVCYNAGDKHPGGCAECDPAADTKTWTVKGNFCLINNECKNPNDKDAIACAECVPATAKYDWTPIAGLCKIHGSCYNSGAAHPGGCATCNPTVSATSWTVGASNRCLINNVCYNANDTNLSGCGGCQPTSDKYNWTTLAGLCSIDGECYTSGATHPNNCGTCNPSQSSTDWTANAGSCVINGTCYASGAQAPASCGSCNPSQSTTQWTVTTNQCLIGSQCYASGAPEPGGCGTCDPSQNKAGWTKAGNCQSSFQWATRFGGTSSDYPYHIATDASGNIYVTGYFTTSIDFGSGVITSKGSNDIFVASYTPSGKLRWAKGFGGTSSDIGYDIAVDGSGNVYVVGRYYQSITFGGPTLTGTSYEIFLASFTSDGTHRWSKSFGSTSSDYGYSVAVDPSGNVTITGTFYNTVNFGGTNLTSKGSADIFLASFSTTGTHRWSKSFGSTSSDYGYKLAADNSGNVYLTGYFYNSVDFGGGAIASKGSTDIFLASYDAGGQHRWSKGFGSTSSDYGYGVAVDNAGNVAITGSFYNTINFGGSTLTSKGSIDAFVASFTSAGTHRWSKSFGGTSSDYGYDVAVDNSGTVYNIGYFYTSVDFGGGAVTSKGSYDIYITAHTSSGAYRWSRAYGSTSGDQGRAITVGPSGNIYAAGTFYSSVDFGGGPLTSAGSLDCVLMKIAP
ncbi:MAG: SBBP repeat-containing protein [Myxococcales bacterium]|nr:SBBP repeat-containing protein [Myxococcales bacterium]